MARQAPNPVDVQEFQFKLHCHLKIFNNEDATLFSKPCNLLASASQYGLIFIGTTTPAFQVIQISSIEKNSESGYHRRLLPLPSCPKHLAVNCDGTKLAVVTEKDGAPFALFYDVTSFTKQDINIVRTLRLSTNLNVNVLEICWNPTVANIFTACKDDGTLGVYELKETTIDTCELPIEAQATCVSWSPKGKQIAVGSRNGKITQYKPDLKAMKVINAPPLEGIQHVVALQWISNYQFIAVFKPPDPDSSANLLVIDSPKIGDTVYTNYDDICYGYGNVRLPQFYTIYQPLWNLLMVASSNSIEVGVMGCQREEWTQWILSDTARAELPLTFSKQESLPIGFTFDVAATEPVIWGETSLPAAPFVLILSHEGLLCCFRVMNMKADAQNICQKPTMLTDISGLNQFTLTSTQPKEIVEPIVQPINPVPTEVGSFLKRPLATEAVSFIKPQVAPQNVVPKQPFTSESIFKLPSPVIPTSSTILTSKTSVETLSLVMSPISTVAPLQLNETNTIQQEADMLIANLIREECENLETELKSLLHKASLLKIDLGTDAEAVELVRETDTLHDFLSEVVETNAAQSTEIYALKQSLIQTWAWYEDARFRLAQTRDTTLEALLRLQLLDPVSQRYLSDIRQMSYYLYSQIKQAGQVLDDQWSDFQDKCKKVVRMKIPTMETIYQAMVRHSIILEKQKYILKDIANRNRAIRSRLSGPSLLKSLNSTDLLEKSLKRLQLEPEQHFLEAQYDMVIQKQKNFTKTKVRKLITLLKQRDITNIKINKPRMSNITANLQTLLQSSPRIKKATEISLIGAGLSPIVTKPTTLWSNTFVQSTPKLANLGVPRNTLATHEQKVFSTELIHKVPASVNEQSQSQFNFVTPQSHSASAFVPTTQLAFSFTNKSPSTTTTPAVSSLSAFTFSGTSLFTVGTSTVSSVTTTSKLVTSTISSDKKGLLSGKQDLPSTLTTAMSTFGTATQSIFTSSSPKTTTSFSFTPKTVSSTPSFSVTSNIFGAKVGTSTPAFNFVPTVTTSAISIFSSTTTSNQFLKTAESFPVVPISSAVKSNNVPSSSTIISTESTLSSISSKTDTGIPSASSITSTLSTILELPADSNFAAFTGEDLSIKATPTPTSVVTIFPNTNVTSPAAASFSFASPKSTIPSIATVVSSTPSTVVIEIKNAPSAIPTIPPSIATGNSSINSSVGIFSNTNTVAPLSSTKSSSVFSVVGTTNATSPISITTVTSTVTPHPEKPETKSIFTATTNSTNFFTATTAGSIFSSIGDAKSSVDFSATSTTSSVLFSSTPLIQTSVSDTKPSLTFGVGTISTPAVTTASIFESTPSETKFVFGTPPGTQSSIFGDTVNKTVPTSGSTTVGLSSGIPSTTSDLFKTVTSTTGQPFGVSNTPQNIFGNPTVPSSSTQSIFGTSQKPLINAPVFGSTFGSETTSASFPFGTVVSTNANVFISTTSTGGSIFGSAPTTTTSLFGSPISSPMTSSIFGAQVPQSGSVFGSTATTSSIFGTATTTAAPIFGSSPFANTGSSVFGSATKTTPFGTTSSGSIFGQQPAFGSAPAFGSPVASPTNTFGSGSSVFGAPPQSSGNNDFASTGFGKPFSFTLPPVSSSTGSFGFGDLNMGSSNTSFTGQTSNPFAKPFAQEQKPFGGGSIFGTPSTTTASVFGGGTPPAFGFGSNSGFATPTFGQQSTFGPQSPFGSPSQPGPFSGGNQSVAQSGFGGFAPQTQKSGFGAAPVFGGSPTAFGSSPSFGGSTFNTSFGSPNKVFSDAANSQTGVFSSSPQQQQNPTFANLANQNTIGFGALAQQGTQQPNQSSFSGGSSFSTWR